MTEYGRGPGSEPWNPEDPLFGDGGWGGQAADGQSPYGGQPQHYPQQPHQQQAQYGDWSNGQQDGYGQGQQFDSSGGQQYPGQGQQQHQGQGQQGYHDQGQQHYGHQGEQRYAEPYAGHEQQQYAGHEQQQYADQGQQQYNGQDQQQYHNGGWDNGTQHQVAYAPDPTDPYGNQAAAYGAEQPDLYGTPDAYPPPEPPARRRAEPEPAPADWDPGPDQGEHAFFAGGDDEDDDLDDDPKGGRGDRKGRGGKDKKRRSGCACLVVVLVFGGGLGGVGYFGYQFYQNRFGPAPDFAGEGTGRSVNIQVPKGAGGAEIGRLMRDAGVVKSVDAFVSAFTQNKDSGSIQAGAYTMKAEMSAASAVKWMLDPKSQNNLTISEGERNSAVYAAIDKKLELRAGTTGKVALKEYRTFGLPEWATGHKNLKDPLEGFLYPATYPAAKGMKPESVLKKMVAQANQRYTDLELQAKAKGLGLDDPFQLVTVASLVQAEGKTHDDFRKMAEVIYNRLKSSNTQTNRLLQFDSTFNYLKKQSNIHISESEINNNKDPYNTYTQTGLPPGPIGNPGDEALRAALNPTDDGWLYFVATDGQNNTEFAKTYAEFQQLKEKFNDSSGKN